MSDESGLRWAYNIPLLTNRYMLWDFARLFFVTFVVATGILFVATGFEVLSIMPLALVGEAIFIGLFILTSILLGNHVGSVFILDKNGVGSKVSRRMSRLNKATIVLGVLAGNPSVAGAGFLASSQGETFHRWSGFEKATVDAKRRVITFHNSWRSVQRIYCYPDNFEQVVAFVSLMLPGKVVYTSRIGGF
ncbi:MAG: hypothetical protein NWF07_01885 [Candidatus Bathyarchaeota archaeon]|nr:hypothetical protein [Candidatus Bathyarchaeota archaeon]